MPGTASVQSAKFSAHCRPAPAGGGARHSAEFFVQCPPGRAPGRSRRRAGVTDSVTVTESVTPAREWGCSKIYGYPRRPDRPKFREVAHSTCAGRAPTFSPERGRTPARLFPAPETTSHSGGGVSSNLSAPLSLFGTRPETGHLSRIGTSWRPRHAGLKGEQRGGPTWAEYLADVVHLAARTPPCDDGSKVSRRRGEHLQVGH